MIDQLWTLLGMFIAWVVLDGSAKTIVGYAIIATLVAWLSLIHSETVKTTKLFVCLPDTFRRNK
jgi:hypothetical protein